MKIKRKSLLLLAIFGLSILYGALCLQICPSGQHGLGLICPISTHSFVYIASELSAILTLMGLILLINITFMPEGFVLPPFRPPRTPKFS